LFLSSRTFHAFKGHSTGQLERIRKCFTSKKSDNPKRQEFVDKFKYDIKMASHLLLWLDELEQIITTNDIDLTRNKEEAKLMREGKWGTFEKLEQHFITKIRSLEDLLLRSSVLPLQPRTSELHQLLENCIEEYFGSIEKSRKTEFVSAKSINEKLSRIELELKELNSNLKI